MSTSQTLWLVGARLNDRTDLTQVMVQEGIWYHNWPDDSGSNAPELTRSMQPGDAIALKSAFVQRHRLPFDAGGRHVSVMRFKALGVVTENPGDGQRVRVAWQSDFAERDWYINVYQRTVTRIGIATWKAQALRAFLFEGAPQDLDRFVADWRPRAPGADTHDDADHRFAWIPFYEEFATRLLGYRDRREELVEFLVDLGRAGLLPNTITDQTVAGPQPLADICPFTFMAMFNRGRETDTRRAIARRLGERLGVEAKPPAAFASIPIVNPQSTWFFGYARDRGPHDIDTHWNLFESALGLLDDDVEGTRVAFEQALDRSLRVKQAKWNLTMGLYWILPRRLVPLDRASRGYLAEVIGDRVSPPDLAKPPSGSQYLQLCDDLIAFFDAADAPVHSPPEFSLAAFEWAKSRPTPIVEEGLDEGADAPEDARPAVRLPYTVDDIVRDGCFVPRAQLVEMLEALASKKNVILQGPPGTGKTWLAKRLCWAHLGSCDANRIAAFQFHPNLAYEDFVLGFRPGGDGRLELRDGRFVAFCELARRAGGPHAVIIDEINRGNPAQVFGELLTLLESDKRNAQSAIQLAYGDRPPFYIPDEVVVVGTMNVADRSLAMVDVALRRRFAFFTLEPVFGAAWRGAVVDCGVPEAVTDTIASRMGTLNAAIAATPGLGANYRIGHSYFVPDGPSARDGAWALRVFKTEIAPLVQEFFADDPSTGEGLVSALLADFAR